MTFIIRLSLYAISTPFLFYGLISHLFHSFIRVFIFFSFRFLLPNSIIRTN